MWVDYLPTYILGRDIKLSTWKEMRLIFFGNKKHNYRYTMPSFIGQIEQKDVSKYKLFLSGKQLQHK